jgi:hypothetical protein
MLLNDLGEADMVLTVPAQRHPGGVCSLAAMVKNRRFQLHVTPTSSSWLNLVKRWFRELTDKALHRRGHSVRDRIDKIEE